MDKMLANNVEYEVIKLLGKGKGGYSYLVKQNEIYYVLKKIHHEPCSYYKFGNKLESEINDYKTLSNLNLRMPKLIDIDYENEIIIKEFIEGNTIEELIKNGKFKEEYINQIVDIGEHLKQNNLNIDYYPTNFVVQNDLLYYIDFECNIYDEKRNFPNWGINYRKIK